MNSYPTGGGNQNLRPVTSDDLEAIGKDPFWHEVRIATPPPKRLPIPERAVEKKQGTKT